MNWAHQINWTKIVLFNFLLVALLGVLMRYKIGFEFPYFDQKNIQHAHSHFAFSGWVSLSLMSLMVSVLKNKISNINIQAFHYIFIAYLVCAWGMFFAFLAQGYGLYSILFSTLSILISFLFCVYYFKAIKNTKDIGSDSWFITALLYNIISTFGTFYLSYMMASKHLDQHHYLASVYWYLHFQYNGWFFFACMGLFIDYLQSNNITIRSHNLIFWLFAISCLPAYGLSILWLKLPDFIYIIIATAAIAQFLSWVLFIFYLNHNNFIKNLKLSTIAKLLLLCVGVALTIKFSLQLGSTIPHVSKLAFGFRPIVIAYLHLVFLAFVSVFLLFYYYIHRIISDKKNVKIGLIIFLSGVFLNELSLAIQGIASFAYKVIPFINETLLGISILMFIGLAFINRIIFD
ncbi:MAG: hypothetical protein SFU99_07690 [Saprospiraceae bacterium]|nr:hypothetical protein [Saprospiraceae bacterium]